MVEHKLVLFATVTALWGLVTLLLKQISHTLKEEIHTRPKFWPICCESDAILCKKFRPGDRAGVFIWASFHLGYRDIGRKNRDLGNRTSPAPHINTSKRVARGDLGNRASPVDRAHMKRPWDSGWVAGRLSFSIEVSYSFGKKVPIFINTEFSIFLFSWTTMLLETLN